MSSEIRCVLETVSMTTWTVEQPSLFGGADGDL